MILVMGVLGVRRIVTLIICVGIVAAIGTWFVVRQNTLSLTLFEQVQRGPGTTVDFNEIAPFAWDRVYIFGPYTPHQRIHDSLGFHWPDVSATTIEYSDVVCLVVFVQSGQVVDWFEHTLNRGDLMQLTNPQGYSREEARFQITLVGAEQRPALVKHQK